MSLGFMVSAFGVVRLSSRSWGGCLFVGLSFYSCLLGWNLLVNSRVWVWFIVMLLMFGSSFDNVWYVLLGLWVDIVVFIGLVVKNVLLVANMLLLGLVMFVFSGE